jgi:hypothetical protein
MTSGQLAVGTAWPPWDLPLIDLATAIVDSYFVGNMMKHQKTFLVRGTCPHVPRYPADEDICRAQNGIFPTCPK